MSLSAEFDLDASHARIQTPVPADLEARFTAPGGTEHPCRIVEMSTGEAVVAAATAPREGDGVVVHVAELGRFEGEVERLVEGGFAISLRLTERQRRKLAEQLLWLANRRLLERPESRRHRRIVPRMRWTRVRLANGKERIVAINDFSRSGVSVDSNAEVSLGDRVAFGLKTAIVGRIFEGGFVAELEEPFAEGELTETTPL